MSQKELVKKYGEGVFLDASFLLDKPKMVIPVSPALDIGLNGGIPEGSWVIFSGQAKTGKSTTALQFAANCQQKEYGSRKVFYDDVEHRLKQMNLTGIHNLITDPKQFQIIRSSKDKILSAEDHLNILVELIKDNPNSVFIIDSASALCAMGEMSEEIKASGRASGPKLLASFCRQVGPIVTVNNSIIIIIQHLIANTSGYGSPYVEDGGQKLKYQVDVKMRIKGIEKWEAKDKRIGQIVNWEIVCSALGAPLDKVQSYLRYGYGIDHITEIIQLGCDLGLIMAGGSWYTLDYLESKPKLQGQHNVYEYLSNNPDDYKKLEKLVKESLV